MPPMPFSLTIPSRGLGARPSLSADCELESPAGREDRVSRTMPPHEPLDDVIHRTLPQLRVFVRSLIGQRLRQRESVSDVVQSAFREVLGDLKDERLSESSLRARLFCAADRKVIENARKHGAARRDIARERPLIDAQSQISNDRQPGAISELREDVERVMRALDAMGTEDREVVILGSILGLSHAQIAKHLGTTELATRSRLSRALARLATRLRRK